MQCLKVLMTLTYRMPSPAVYHRTQLTLHANYTSSLVPEQESPDAVAPNTLT